MSVKKANYSIVHEAESYSVAEFRRRLAIGQKLWRQLRDQGLIVREAGRRRFVLGKDWHEFLARTGL
jgi:hypothetical protein